MDRRKQPGIEIAQIVVERAQFAHREDYLSLPSNTQVSPLPLRLKARFGLDANKKNGNIKLEVVTDEEQKPLYILNLVLVALIRVEEGAANMSLERYAAVNGAAMLFPFVRELVANLTSRGRFGPVWLHPINLVAGARTNSAPGADKPRSRSVRRKK